MRFGTGFGAYQPVVMWTFPSRRPTRTLALQMSGGVHESWSVPKRPRPTRRERVHGPGDNNDQGQRRPRRSDNRYSPRQIASDEGDTDETSFFSRQEAPRRRSHPYDQGLPQSQEKQRPGHEAPRRRSDSYDDELTRLQEKRRSGHDFLFGVAPVLAALMADRREFHALHIQDSMDLGKRKDKDALDKVKELAEKYEIPIEPMTKGDLNVLSENRPHQGLVLEVSPLSFKTLNRMHSPNHEKLECWLVLDEISDPMNMGALCRTAFFLGASGVVTCQRNSSPLSPVVSKASVGAIELMEVHATNSMPRFLRGAKDLGWRIIGGAIADDALECRDLRLDHPTMLVLGSEGTGLRPLVAQTCSSLVKIGSRADSLGTVDSLNVSVAGAILLHQLLSS